MNPPITRPTRAPDSGFTFVEIVVALLVFAVVMMGMASMTGHASQQLRAADSEDERWAVVHQKMEELVARDTADLAAGSEVIRGYPVSWTVTKGDPTEVVLVVAPWEASVLTRTDTVVTYVDNR